MCSENVSSTPLFPEAVVSNWKAILEKEKWKSILLYRQIDGRDDYDLQQAHNNL